MGKVVGILIASLLTGQPPAAESVDKFPQAEKLFQAGRLLEAAEIYRPITLDEKHPHRLDAFDRLIAVTMRLGRCDQAIQTGEAYIDLLHQVGNVRAARLVDVQMGACWWALGHYRVAEKKLQGAMANALDDFPLATQVTAWEMLARCQSQRSDPEASRKSWAAIEAIVAGRFRNPDAVIEPKERVELTRHWAESLIGQRRFGEAEAVLKSALPLHDRLKDDAGRRDAWKELATLYRVQDRLEDADAAIDQALKIHAGIAQPTLSAQADLEAERAEIFQLRKNGKEAKVWRDRAIDHYQQAFRKPDADDRASGVMIFWKLQNLIQQSQQFRKALELTQSQAEQWAGGSLLSPKFETEQGSLLYLLGSTKSGRQLLRDAVDSLERQRPWNLIELPRALINLAAVEAASGDLDTAQKLVERTLNIYDQFALPDDGVVVEALNLRGTVEAQRGDFARAIKYFREGLRRNTSATTHGPMQRSNLLLNIALLHKSQGEIPEAIKVCTEALGEFEKICDPDALGLAAFDAGLANMHLAQNQLAKAFERGERIDRLCRLHGLDRGPLVVAVRHLQAIQSLQNRDFSSAEAQWKSLLDLQEREEQTLLAPRTLNYLALTAELRKDRVKAERLYRRSLDVQDKSARSFPATHFITLWRLANVIRDDRPAEAQRHLDRAIQLVEKARLRTFGDAQQRASFFAQFATAFEQSIDWLVSRGDVEQAFQVLTRGRSRTLMDQLQMANLDPLATLTGPEGAKLIAQERSLRTKLAALRAKASLVGVESLSKEQVQSLLAEFDSLQQTYAETWREIWNASPEYHSLADPTLPEQVLPKLRERVLGSDAALIAFSIGKQSSHVFLIDRTTAVAFPLTIPENLARHMAPVDSPSGPDKGLDGLRGVAIVPKGGAKSAAPPLPAATSEKRIPLSVAAARTLLDRYRLEILDRDFSGTRGVVIKSRDPARPLAPQRPDVVGSVFLPKELRDRIAALNPRTLIVIPDGPLHTVPLEAVVLESGSRPKYVLDEMPPLIYAPSASILVALSDRAGAAPRRRSTLLTVCNPAYLESKSAGGDDATRDFAGVLGFAGQLPRLPFTDQESKQIRRYFQGDAITALAEADATERNVAQAVRGKSIVHIAAHGFADSRFGNLFGALALSPSATPLASSEDDGFLSLHEIYRLPLEDCDLAVLSACLTHVGPQQPLEAGVTLANGFLSAGARRVVASHWSVADRSTSQLMTYFFEALTRQDADGRRPSTPQAMRDAQLRLRANAEHDWTSPFYWAPFVVLGLPEPSNR